jgi:hypothetical protein
MQLWLTDQPKVFHPFCPKCVELGLQTSFGVKKVIFYLAAHWQSVILVNSHEIPPARLA